MFHGNNFVFIIEFNVFSSVILLVCLFLHCKFLGGIAQYGSNVRFYSSPLQYFFLFRIVGFCNCIF